MNIGIFTEVYEPYPSGVVTSVVMLKKGLEDLGCNVYIVTPNLKNNKFIYDKDNHVLYLPGIKTGIYDTKLTNIYSKKASKIIHDWHLDIVHTQTEFGMGIFGRLIAKNENIPVVHTYHTLYEDYVYYVTHGLFIHTAKKIARDFTKNYCDKKCNTLIVPTEKIKKLLKLKYHVKKEINVIPTGIDTSKFILDDNKKKEVIRLKKKLNILDNDFVIGSVGRLSQEKNTDELIMGFKKLYDKYKNVKLLLIGTSSNMDRYKELIKMLEIDKNVIITGKVPYDSIPLYYNIFNALATFSVTETQGLTLIEGLASNVPVVAINDASFKEMIKDNYNGIFFNNSNDFVEKTLKLIKDKKAYQYLQDNTLKSVLRYSKEVFAKSVLDIYKKTINNYNKEKEEY